VWECHEESLPLNRPLYLQWPEEEDAYRAPQGYLFGPYLLVYPVASHGFGPERVASQAVWFPPGEWVNTFTNERYTGPQWRLVSADINEWPMYARLGAPIPAQPYSERPTTESLDHLIVHIWPGEGSYTMPFDLYEDDGKSQDYEAGQHAITKIKSTHHDGIYTVTLSPTEGTYDGQPKERSVEIIMHGMAVPENVELNNDASQYKRIDETGDLIISYPKSNIRETIAVNVTGKLMPSEYFQKRAYDRHLKGILGEANHLSLEDALQQDTDEINDVAPGLLALAGVGYVENETAYPEPGAHRRIVVNDDNPLDVESIAVTLRHRVFPQDEVLSERTTDYQNPTGVVDVDAPSEAKLNPEFLTSHLVEREVKYKFKGITKKHIEVLDKKFGWLDNWLISEAYDYDPEKPMAEQVFAPETASLDDLLAMAKQDDWQTTPTNNKGELDLLELHDEEFKIAYALNTIEVEAEQEIVLGFRSDDGIAVWLNGEKIHEADEMRGINHDWENVPVTLKAGENILLLKISQHKFGWGFAVIGRDPALLEAE
jgi:hypothetical protein